MVSKERINRPKLCFRVIRSRIIFHHVKDHFYSGPFSLFLFIFTLTHFALGLFRFTFLLFFCIFLNICISCKSKFLFRTQAFHSTPFENRHLHDLSWFSEFHFLTLAPSLEGDPWSGFRKKIIRLKKRDYWIIFCISEGIIKDDHFSSQT